jgi:nucleotide-binding universal stress UspA family protein
MYRTIMVPLDGSLLAERALPYAQALAKASRGDIVVVRVVAPPRFPAEYHHLGQTNEMAEAQAYLATIVARMGPDVSIKAETYFDDPAMAIVNEVHRRPMDLLVMSTHGRAGLGGLIYGSVAEQVFRHLEIPALILPPGCSRVWPVDRRPRILVPLDGSDLASDVLPSARTLAGVLDAELRFLRIVAPPTFKHVEGYPDLVRVPRGADVGEAQSYLETIAANVPADGPIVTTEVVESTNPASTIATVAEENAADVIAMSTHGRSGIARLVMGSVAAGTIQRAAVPILLVRPTAMRHPMAQPQIIKSGPGIRPPG